MKKGFFHGIVTGDEKCIHYYNPQDRSHTTTSTPRSNIYGSKIILWFDYLGVIYYELLKSSETMTGERYKTLLMRMSYDLKVKRTQYNERYDKVTA